MTETPRVAERGASSLLLPRILGALALRPAVYKEIAADRTAGFQCIFIVLASAVFETASSAALHGERVFDALAPASVAGPMGWLIWSGLLWMVGARALAHGGEFPDLMRAVGLAHAPGLILGLALLPGLSILTGSLYFVALVWFAATLVTAAIGFFAVPLPRALLVVGVSFAAHETFRQGLRLFLPSA